MTFGIDKACVAVIEGSLLGHDIGRKGAKCSAEKTRPILKFPPLREKLHIQQFLGCTNFLRSYLPPGYAHCAKLLGEYVKGASPSLMMDLGQARLRETSRSELRRAVKRSIGPTRSICWTDHADWMRQQSCETAEPKHLRWLSELLG